MILKSLKSDSVWRDQSYIHWHDPACMCDEWVCHGSGSSMCVECGKDFCDFHVSSIDGRALCHNCHQSDSATCNVPDCHWAVFYPTCQSRHWGFCDDHVGDYQGWVECMHCMGQYDWQQHEYNGRCEMDGCFKMKQHACGTCGKRLCHEHVAKTDVALLGSADFCNNCQMAYGLIAAIVSICWPSYPDGNMCLNTPNQSQCTA